LNEIELGEGITLRYGEGMKARMVRDESANRGYVYEAEEEEGGDEGYGKNWKIDTVQKKVLSARLHNDEISNEYFIVVHRCELNNRFNSILAYYLQSVR